MHTQSIDDLADILDQIEQIIQSRIEVIKADRGTYAWDPDGVRHKYVIAQQTWCDGQLAAYEDVAVQLAKLKTACS